MKSLHRMAKHYVCFMVVIPTIREQSTIIQTTISSCDAVGVAWSVLVPGETFAVVMYVQGVLGE